MTLTNQDRPAAHRWDQARAETIISDCINFALLTSNGVGAALIDAAVELSQASRPRVVEAVAKSGDGLDGDGPPDSAAD